MSQKLRHSQVWIVKYSVNIISNFSISIIICGLRFTWKNGFFPFTHKTHDHSDDDIYRLPLSRAIHGPSFIFMLHVEVQIPGQGVHLLTLVTLHFSPLQPFMLKELNIRRVKGANHSRRISRNFTKYLL